MRWRRMTSPRRTTCAAAPPSRLRAGPAPRCRAVARRSRQQGRRLRARRLPAGGRRPPALRRRADERALPPAWRIGRWSITAVRVLAPDGRASRTVRSASCAGSLGAGLAASEMITSDQRLWHTTKTRQRMNHEGEPEPRVVQLAGNDPRQLAEAARINADLGAQIIDINMGCPAKKVYGKLCGSALLGDEPLVGRILEAVVARLAGAGDAEDTHRHRSRPASTRRASHASQQRPACRRSRSTAARARTSTRARPSTRRSARSVPRQIFQ